MKSNRQARHILGLDHKISNQRKIVTEGDKSSVVNNPTGRKRPAEKFLDWTIKFLTSAK